MNTGLTILVVEDQVREREALSRMLKSEGYRTIHASNQPEAMKAFREPVDLVVCDLRLGNDNGLDVLKQWRESKPSVPVLMVTAYGDIHSAVEAMKLGASDYLTKPLKPDELLVLLNRYLPMRAREPKHSTIDEAGIGRMIGQSDRMKEVFDQIHRVSLSDSTVLIVGESGTGKELVASAIHENSRRHNESFVAVNVTALPDALIESELLAMCEAPSQVPSNNAMGASKRPTKAPYSWMKSEIFPRHYSPNYSERSKPTRSHPLDRMSSAM